MRNKLIENTAAGLLVLIVAYFSYSVPSTLSREYLPLNIGPDEVSHIDYTYFKYVRPDQKINVRAGFYAPGMAPTGQGHQPPLSYWLGAKLLSSHHQPEHVGGFIDYQAGFAYSSDFYHSPCMFCMDPSRTGAEVNTFREAIIGLRAFNSFLFALCIPLAFLTTLFLIPNRPFLAAAVSVLTASVPTAIWRAIFVNNGNLATLLGTLIVTLGAYHLKRHKKIDTKMLVIISFTVGLAFLSKYNSLVLLTIPLLLCGLTKGVDASSRVKASLLCVVVFFGCVFLDLWENFKTDGDFFSESIVVHVADFIYQKRSILEVLTGTKLLSATIERFWLGLINVGSVDPSFTFSILFVWWTLLGLSVVGWIVKGGTLIWKRREAPRGALSLRAFIYCAVPVLGMFAFLINFWTRFALPEGRYLSPISTPLLILLVAGLTFLLQLFVKKAKHIDIALLAVFCVVFIYNSSHMHSFLKSSISSCRTEPMHIVPAGGDAVAADIDGNGKDELLLFHRVRNRVFAFRQAGNSFELERRWTRMTGLLTDELLAEDINEDRRDDLLFYRPGNGQWFVASGKSFVEHDPTISPYRDKSAPPKEFASGFEAGDRPFIGDVNGDSWLDVMVFRITSGEWIARTKRDKSAPFERSGEEQSRLLESLGEQPVLVNTPSRTLLGTYQAKTGKLAVVDFESPKEMILPFTKKDFLFAADLNADGMDDLIFYSEGDNCLEVHYLVDVRSEADSRFFDIGSRAELCIFSEGKELRFGRHQKLIALTSGKRGPVRVVSFDRRTGIVSTLFDTSNKSLPPAARTHLKVANSFDPGWLAPETKRKGFVSLDALQ